MIVPWIKVAEWRCTTCGRCCRDYKVPLTFGEYIYFRKFGAVEERRKYYLRKVGGRCIFQYENLCGIQSKKPIACKLFPFLIRERCKDERALFEYNGDEYFVFVNTYCRNIRYGTPTLKFKEIIKEAVEIYTGRKKRQVLLTS
jgi:hypothetical protein